MELSPFRPLGTPRTGGTQSVQVTRYPGDWWDYVILERQVPWRLVEPSPFSPGTLRTGGTQSFQAPRYPGDWRESVLSVPKVPWGLVGLSSFSPPGTLGTGGTLKLSALRLSSLNPPKYPGDGRNPVLSAPQVPWGLGPTKRTGAGESVTESRRLGLVLVLVLVL